MIVDGHIMENEADSQIVISTANRLTPKYNIDSWSFDKGYSHKDNKAVLSEVVEQVIMPKKGKRNKAEDQEEGTSFF